jgi:hypothetical protein
MSDKEDNAMDEYTDALGRMGKRLKEKYHFTQPHIDRLFEEDDEYTWSEKERKFMDSYQNKLTAIQNRVAKKHNVVIEHEEQMIDIKEIRE